MKPTPEPARSTEAVETPVDVSEPAVDEPAAHAELDLLGHLGAELQHGRAGRAELTAQIEALRGERDRALVALAHSRARETLAWESAHHDTLTGLPNRLGFEAAWSQALAAHATGPRVFALLFIDLDGFKAINDRLGHAAGDELLTIVGARLAHALRRGDSVCRHGGDEFLCLLTQLRKPAEAHRIAEWLLHTIAAPCRLRLAVGNGATDNGTAVRPGHGQDGQAHRDPTAEAPEAALVSVQPSIGIALYPRDGRSAQALIGRADAAMYRAKTQRLGVAGGEEVSEVSEVVSQAADGKAADGKANQAKQAIKTAKTGASAVSRPPRPSPRDGVFARAAAAPAPHRSSRRPRSPG